MSISNYGRNRLAISRFLTFAFHLIGEPLVRLHVGPPPVPADFEPEAGGWTALREPSPLWLNVLAIPVAAITIAALTLAWGPVKIQGSTDNPSLGVILIPILGFVGLIAVHELIHALAYPRFGMTDEVTIGVWPSKLLFYAISTGPVNRDRLLVVYLLPLAVLSLLPLVVCRLMGVASPVWFLVSAINGMASAGDLVCVALIASQVPATAVVRNKGWASWWQEHPVGRSSEIEKTAKSQLFSEHRSR